MTAGTRYATEAFRVWVMEPTGGDYWVVSGGNPVWTETQRLRPAGAFTSALGSKGSASFELGRAVYIDEDGVEQTDAIDYVPGMYVAIARGDSADPSLAADWYGQIQSISETTISNGDDGTARVSARQLGWALYDISLTGWRRQAGTTAAGVAMQSPPTANLTAKGGKIYGNAALTASEGVYQFADTFNDLGQTSAESWNATRLLEHAIKYTLPTGAPTINVTDDTAGAIDALDAEVWRIGELTFGQLLDLVAPRSRGFDWTLLPIGDEWYVSIVGTTEAAATVEDVTLGDWCSGFDVQTGEQIDEVIVEGQPIVWAGTASIKSGTLSRGWSQTDEDAFLVAGSAADEAAAQTERKKSRYAAVYSRFELLADSNFQFLKVDDGAGVDVKLCLEVEWDGATATIGTDELGPDYPSARILSWMPLEETRDASPGTNREKAPTYMPPKVFVRDGSTYTDLSAPAVIDDQTDQTPQIRADDRAPAIFCTYPYQEGLGYDSASAAIYQPSVGTTAPSALENKALAGTANWYDWDDQSGSGGTDGAYLSFAVASGQRLRVSETRSGVTNPRKVLKVRRKDFACWCARDGLRYESDQVYGANTILRNDYAKAQALLDELADFAFQPRKTATITYFDRANAPWAVPGTLLGVVTYGDDANRTRTLNTVVSQVSCNTSTGEWAVVTDYPVMPGTVSGGGSGMGGGTVSPTLSNSGFEATANAQSDRDEDVREAQRKVIVESRPNTVSGGSGTLPITFDWNVVAHGFSVGDWIWRTSAGSYALATETLAHARYADGTQPDGWLIGVVTEVADVDNFTTLVRGVWSSATGIPAGGPGQPIWLNSGASGSASANAQSGDILLGALIESVGGGTSRMFVDLYPCETVAQGHYTSNTGGLAQWAADAASTAAVVTVDTTIPLQLQWHLVSQFGSATSSSFAYNYHGSFWMHPRNAVAGQYIFSKASNGTIHYIDGSGALIYGATSGSTDVQDNGAASYGAATSICPQIGGTLTVSARSTSATITVAFAPSGSQKTAYHTSLICRPQGQAPGYYVRGDS